MTRHQSRFSRASALLLTAAVVAWIAGAVIAPPSARAATTLPSGFVETRNPAQLYFPSVMAAAPDGRMFVGERNGNLRVFKNDVLLPTPFVSLTVDQTGERGLIGIAFDPDFANNQWVYLYYTATTPTIHNRISRFTANGDVVVPGSEVVLLDLDDLGSNQHNGGAMHFGPDGKLYAAVGDNMVSTNAQTTDNLLGKVLRINKDGSIPTDNPFYGSATGRNRAIWAFGLRNPFTFDVQPGTGRMYIDDVGLSTWEEINEGQAGANYGWPATEGPTSDPRFRSPFFAYNHGSGNDVGCAVTGGTFYNPPNPQFPAQYLGKYFFIDFCNGWIRTLDPTTGTADVFASGMAVWNTIYVTTAPDGSLYYLTTADPAGNGALFKITYNANLAPQIGTQPVDQTVTVGDTASFSVTAYGNAPLTYQWQRNGVDIPGATGPSYTTAASVIGDDGGLFHCVVTNGLGSATSRDARLTVTTDHRPTPTINSPPDGSGYNAGDTIAFSGSATDAEDGTPPPSAYSWQVDLHHNTHIHPAVFTTAGVTSGTFTVPNDGETSTNVFYRFLLTVTDSQGLSTTTYHDVRPNLSQINLATNPPGLSLTIDGPPVTTPYSTASVVGMGRPIGAPLTQTVGGVTYDFASWSDGGAAQHIIYTPATATTYTATYRARANGSISASPNPVTVTDGSGLAVTTINWTSASTSAVQVRIGSPTGALFAQSGAGNGSQATGKWVRDGTVFYLQNVSGGLPLTAANTLGTTTVNVISRTGSITASPNPIVVTDGSGLGATTLNWTSAGTSTVEVHVGSPTGPLFARSGTGNASSKTGKWVTNGMVFYLQDVSGGLPLTAANTVGTVTVNVVARTGSITANPNPITVTDGTGLGITTLNWTSAGTSTVEVHIGSPSGPLFSRSGPGNRSATTGKWVSNGTVFYLQDVSGGSPLTSANTLATVTVTVR